MSAKKIAFSVASSPLVKTAVAGEDPNWGRIIMGIGKSGEVIDPKKLKIKLGDFTVAENGKISDTYNEEKSDRSSQSKRRRTELITKAFNLLSGSSSVIDRETVLAVFIVLNEDFPDIKYIKRQEAELIFEVLDTNNSVTLDED